MWTLIVLALAAMLWLLQVTLGEEAAGGGLLRSQVLHHTALGFSVLGAVMVLQRGLQHLLFSQPGKRPSASSDLLRAVMSISLYLLAAMLYLRWGLGQDISSVLATSAMLSVIIGLALQPTLGHLFAGVSIEIERPLRVGDHVRRDDLEGQVVSLNWRSVYLRTERGSTVLMPNSEFTSRTVEVIPAERPFRHQAQFNVASTVPPGQVIRVAMQVLRSGLPALCEHPSPSVIVQGNDPVTGTLRYVARFYTLQFLDRGSLASAFLERFWYALSREDLSLPTPPSAWWPTEDEGPGHKRGEAGSRARLLPLSVGEFDPELGAPAALSQSQFAAAAPLEGSAEDQPPSPALRPSPLGFKAPPGLAQQCPTLWAALLACAQPLRYGRLERCEGPHLALLHSGRLREERPLPETQVQAQLKALLEQWEALALQAEALPAVSLQMGQEAYENLLNQATLAMGPLAYQSCRRIAALTDDLHLAYHALAHHLPQGAARERFLGHAPAQSHRVLHAGEFLGWPQLLGLEPHPLPCLATQSSLLLIWPAQGLRQLLRQACPPSERQALLHHLRAQMPGCEGLDDARWQAWLGPHAPAA